MEALWKAVDANWGEILAAFRSNTEYKMYDDEGNFVDSNRPLIENLVDAKMSKDSSFWLYMELLMHDPSIRREGSNIYVSCGTPLPLAGGGAEEIIRQEESDECDTSSESILQPDEDGNGSGPEEILS